MTMLAAALHYTRHGLAVFPVRPDSKQSHKCAAHSDGRAWGMTRDAAEIRRDFTRWPNARIGIPTGADNGIVVVETDTREGHGVDGAASLALLEAEHDALPETLKAISPSGSIHRYFRHPGTPTKIKNSASEIGTGIDVRGDGGMVIAPPSITPGVGVYRWLNRNPIAAMPTWLAQLACQKSISSEKASISRRAVAAIKCPISGPNGYGAAALAAEIEQLASTAPGGRNHALNRASFSLHQLVGGGELDAAEVERALYQAAETNGLVADDGAAAVLRTIESGRHAGLQCPRSRPS
jgi:Bifunctional DNA primase/polymerase, N-terminal